MPSIIGNEGNALELTIPTRIDLNWDAIMQAALVAITTHNHDGGSNGATVVYAAGSVPNAMLATMPANTVKMNNTGGVASPSDVTTANAFIALFETKATALGDLIYGGSSGTPTRLAGDTSNTKKFLRETASSGVATAPVWDTVLAADIPCTSANVLVGNASNVATAVPLTGDVSITNAGATTVATVGTSTAANVHAAELLANAATSANTSSAIVRRDANKNALVNTIVEGLVTTVTSATPVVLTNASAPIQEFTGTTAQTVTLPDATTLAVGWPFSIINKSTAVITLNTNGAALLISVPAKSSLTVYAVTVASAAGTWDTSLLGGQGQILATATNDTAAAGNVGEVMRITRVRSAATAMTSPNPLNVCTTTSITLTAGDWNVQGMVGLLTGTATSVTDYQAAISKTTAALPATDTQCVPTSGECRVDQDTAANVIGTAADISITIPPFQVTVATTLQLFLVAKAVFSASTLSAYGSMEARRVR